MDLPEEHSINLNNSWKRGLETRADNGPLFLGPARLVVGPARCVQQTLWPGPFCYGVARLGLLVIQNV